MATQGKEEDKATLDQKKFKKYQDHELHEVISYFNVNSERDREVLNYFFHQFMQDKAQTMKVKDLVQASKEMAAMIEERAAGMKKVTVKMDKGEAGLNTAAMYFDL